MFTCTICKFETELDDLQVGGKRGICIRCFARETGTAIEMPNPLRREIEAFLAGLSKKTNHKERTGASARAVAAAAWHIRTTSAAVRKERHLLVTGGTKT